MNTDKRRLKSRFLSCISCLFLLIFLLSACGKSEKSDSGSLDIFALDETNDAAQIVADANEDLKRIRKIYKDNSARVEELKAAMNEKKVEDVKKIADDLKNQINDGMALGETAVEKITKAKEMNINEKYRDYLDLKEQSLRQQLDAFEFRRQAAMLLNKGFGGRNVQEIERAKAEFKQKEDNFQKYMEEARRMSQDANTLYKESLQQSN